MGDARLYIDGAFVEGRGRIVEVEDPATEEVFASVAGADAAQVEGAIAAAHGAFVDRRWAGVPGAERVAVLVRMAGALAARRDELVETIVRETGSPTAFAQFAQVGMALDHARRLPELFASLPEWEHNENPYETLIGPDGRDVFLSIRRYEPCGVVAAITPYNAPLMTNVWKVFSALAAGCSVVLRPSPLTPLNALVLGAAAEEAGLPPGVLNIVAEAGAEGALSLTTDPRVDCVSFTGSTTVGRQIAAQAAPTLKRLVLELGGKSVQLYLDDAVDGAAAGACAVFGALAGQACVAQGRVLVPQARVDEVVARLVGAARSLPVGDPRDPRTVVGPVISAAQRDRVLGLVAEGVDAGAVLACGGGRPAGLTRGHYVEPTVLVVEDNANPAAQREFFGPVVSVQGYRDVDHAVAIANDTEYGLSGAVYTGDLRAGLAVAQRIRSGTVQVNRAAANAYTPMGGMKQSGLGRERGVAGLREYQEIQHVVVAPGAR